MIQEKIKEQLNKVLQTGLEDMIKEHGITITYCGHLQAPAYLLMTGGKATIIMRNDLTPQEHHFVLLHEIGHYLLDYENGTYSFNAQFSTNKSELHANLFACLYLIEQMEYLEESIIDYLKRCGCPSKIASNIYDYLCQNMDINKHWCF